MVPLVVLLRLQEVQVQGLVFTEQHFTLSLLLLMQGYAQLFIRMTLQL